MSILNRIFGKKESAFEHGPVANSKIDNPLSLQVLFKGGVNLADKELHREFTTYHPHLSKATVEIDGQLSDKGTPIGLIGWAGHVIQIIGFDLPMPAEAVENCVAPSHYSKELKDQARAHQSHLILFYKGNDNNPVNQYAAMALVAGFLSRYGAVVVTNESARTSFPASSLCGDAVEGDIIELLASLPLAVSYCGFVKYEVEGVNGVWLRTYGAPLLGLPDMASLVKDHSASQSIFDVFSNIFSYLLNSGARFAPGNTMQIGEGVHMKLRLPVSEEYYLESEDELFVAEFISETEINRPG